ncbi:hypothetical protein [Rhizobium leguminosarum]|uniref:hypothetical protein n=1 Tax=Rhizobium leguminosarum TaxID=384 RepID=UPI0021BBD755|nr:hypothetical protein [Rhizobium leguminosarum]
MGGNGQFQEHTEQGVLMAAGRLAHGERGSALVRLQGGAKGIGNIGDGLGVAAVAVAQGDVVAGDVQAEDGLDFGGFCHHNRVPCFELSAGVSDG